MISVYQMICQNKTRNARQDEQLLKLQKLLTELYVKLIMFIVPTLLRGEELYTQLVFFLFREFSPLDIFIVESWDWYH